MPNHVTNHLIAPKAVLDSIAGPESAVDFNAIIPMPEILKGESATPMIEDWAKIATGHFKISSLFIQHRNPGDSFKAGDYGAAADAMRQATVIRLLQDGPFPKDFNDEDFALFIRYITALKQHGHPNWHEWSRETWGTKWNAYRANRKSETVAQFETAWSAPIPVIVALSKKFPNQIIRLRWADEDFGSNAGDLSLRNGRDIEGGRLADDTPEAHALALELIYDGKVPDDYEMINGKLIYREDEPTAPAHEGNVA